MTVESESGRWSSPHLPATWCWVDFASFWRDFTDSHRKLPLKDYSVEGEFLVVDQGAQSAGGRSDRAELLSLAPLPVVIFGDHTRAIKFVERPFIQGADGVKVLASQSGIEPRFAFYALNAMTLPNKGYSRHFKFLTRSEFPLAPLAEQQRIVAKLDALTDRTARARAHLDRIPALATRYKQAVLASCFTPENSGELVELGSVVSLENGDRGKNYPSDSEQKDVGHCLFLGTRNVQHGRFDWNEPKFISRSKHDLLSGGTLRRGDVVLTIRGTLGNCAVYDETAPFEVVRINSAMIIVRPKANVLPRYVMWALRSPAFLGWVSSSARGSAQPHLRAADIKSTKIRLPDLKEQAAIVLRVERAFAEIDRLAAESSTARRLLDRLDQAILAKAFRGELVPQDLADEPASVLLDRIRAERAAAPKTKRGRKAVA